MGAIGMLNTNPDLSPEQQQAGTQQIIGMMESQMSFLNSLYGGTGSTTSYPTTGIVSTGTSGGTSGGSTTGSYLTKYPDVQQAYQSATDAELQWIASLGYPATADGFARWHYDTYGKNEGRSW
jgi:hypothetical protein